MQKDVGRSETLEQFTSRAIRATGTMIPPRVYIPIGLRRKKLKLVGGRMTVSPTTPEEDAERIADADPVGMLIAIMQGQPIPAFRLSERADGAIDVAVEFEVPSVELRTKVAQALARGTKRMTERDVEFEKALHGVR